VHNREFLGASRELKLRNREIMRQVWPSPAKRRLGLHAKRDGPFTPVDFAAPIEITIEFGFVLPTTNSAY
jgi:hypothetical protein